MTSFRFDWRLIVVEFYLAEYVIDLRVVHVELLTKGKDFLTNFQLKFSLEPLLSLQYHVF